MTEAMFPSKMRGSTKRENAYQSQMAASQARFQAQRARTSSSEQQYMATVDRSIAKIKHGFAEVRDMYARARAMPPGAERDALIQAAQAKGQIYDQLSREVEANIQGAINDRERMMQEWDREDMTDAIRDNADAIRDLTFELQSR